MNELFISYSRKDLDFTKRIVDGLRSRGIDPWFDLEDIRPAVKWRQEILIGVQACQNFIYIVSPDSTSSIYCDMELNHALLHNKRIIPILCRHSENLLPALKELNWIFFHNFDEGMRLLIEAVENPRGVSTGDRLDSVLQIQTVGELSRFFYLYRNSYMIGRAPQVDIQESGTILVNDLHVSRSHLRLSLIKGRWIAEDISRNGVRINGFKLPQNQSRPLRHRDRIDLTANSVAIYEEIYPDDFIVRPDEKSTLF